MNRFSLLLYNTYSLFVCLRFFPLRQAMRRPLLLHPSVRIKGMRRGAIVIRNRGRLVFGFEGAEGRSNYKSMLKISSDGRMVLNGYTTMAKGTRLIIDHGEIEIGRHFFCNGDCSIRCTTSIKIGNDNMWGWNVDLNTSDGHHVFENGVEKAMEGNITIGNRVWLASHSHIGKDVVVASGCVVAQNSLVLGKFEEEHCLIGGIPAKKIKGNFSWRA